MKYDNISQALESDKDLSLTTILVIAAVITHSLEQKQLKEVKDNLLYALNIIERYLESRGFDDQQVVRMIAIAKMSIDM